AEGTKRGKFVMIDKEVMPMGLSIMFMGIAYSAVLSFLNLYAIEIDLITAASIFFLVYSAAVLLTRPVTGKILDSFGANIILYPGLYCDGCRLFRAGTGHCRYSITACRIFNRSRLRQFPVGGPGSMRKYCKERKC